MIRINLEKDKVFTGCYNADKEQWDLYATDFNLSEIPTDIMVSQDGDDYWHAYLVKAKWCPKSAGYELTYKDY